MALIHSIEAVANNTTGYYIESYLEYFRGSTSEPLDHLRKTNSNTSRRQRERRRYAGRRHIPTECSPFPNPLSSGILGGSGARNGGFLPFDCRCAVEHLCVNGTASCPLSLAKKMRILQGFSIRSEQNRRGVLMIDYHSRKVPHPWRWRVIPSSPSSTLSLCGRRTGLQGPPVDSVAFFFFSSLGISPAVKGPPRERIRSPRTLPCFLSHILSMVG